MYFDLKATIYMTPKGSREESVAETRKYENRGCNSEDWRGKLRRRLRRRDLHLLHVFIIITMIKGE
jgi:hypothetical protein